MAAFAKSFCSPFLRSSTSVAFHSVTTLSNSRSAWSWIKVLHPFSVTKSSIIADPLDLAETGRSPFLHAAAATRAEQPRHTRSLIALRSSTAFPLGENADRLQHPAPHQPHPQQARPHLAEQGQADPLLWRFKSPEAYYAPHLASPKPDRDEPWCAPAFVDWGEEDVEAWARGEGI